MLTPPLILMVASAALANDFPSGDPDGSIFKAFVEQYQGEIPALPRERLGPHVLVRMKNDRPRGLIGMPIGNIRLQDPGDVDEAFDAVQTFFQDQADIYKVSRTTVRNLEIGKALVTDRISLHIHQWHHGVRVLEGDVFAAFDREGRFIQLTGAPVPAHKLSVHTDPPYPVAYARHAVKRLTDDAEIIESVLLTSEEHGLIWRFDTSGRSSSNVITISAETGEVIAMKSDLDHGVKAVPITRYRHTDGSRTDETLSTTNVNVDYDQILNTSTCIFRLQRLGSGRARVWQGLGQGPTPLFPQTTFVTHCNDQWMFQNLPGATSDNMFSQQQVYFWAQALKTRVDVWGRQPNSFGHYPTQVDRRVNVEIVVNGHKSRQEDWGSPVIHGFFKQSTPTTWFSNHPSSAPSVPAVFLFNVGSESAPHFIGDEYSPTFAIVAHEVGHFIEWSYGRFSESTLREGFAMTFPPLMAKNLWANMDYDDDGHVNTGGAGGWHRHTGPTDLAKHSEMNCGENVFVLARPFLQAMWHLMNNRNESGDPIWSDDNAAILNTADRFMNAMHTQAASATWDDIGNQMVLRTYEAIYTDQTELSPTPLSFFRVASVFGHHGLMGSCLP